MIKFFQIVCFIFLIHFPKATLLASNASPPWVNPSVDPNVVSNVLYIPISDPNITKIQIKDSEEDLTDLLKINNPRIKRLSEFDSKYEFTYAGYSKIRHGVYLRLIKMLEILPDNIGIAYFEGLRPLDKQKEYFDKKFREILLDVKDKEVAYNETTKSVSPFINNIPTHCTGAAIDITLFERNKDNNKLLDMGKFGTIYGNNDQQNTFSNNISKKQKANRLLLLDAARKAGLVNYGFEWWHYSYGDKMWAYLTNQEFALYGLAVSKDDPIIYIDKESYLNSINE